MEEEIDFKTLKYALYVRKSTDDPERQIRSIDDQVDECEKFADRLGLHIVRPYIKETKSAKRPGQRPLFTQMLRDIKNGKYDGIIAWNPDRLARNMKEGGEIIDMIDEGLLKDLKFVTHHFTSDANGKMLLGMAFVLSKQYSDKLSQDVKRGVRKNFEEGKSPMFKHGYKRDENGKYIPDDKNNELIKSAWNMRKNGIGLEAIAKEINSLGYKRRMRTGIEVDMDKRMLTDLFRDPFYYGVLIQKGKEVDLREVPGYKFIPTITEEDYTIVQQIGRATNIPMNTKRKTFYPFKGLLFCYYCNRALLVAPSTGSKKQKYLYARCDTEWCKRNPKSIRISIILDFMYELFSTGLGFTEKDYDKYYGKLTSHSEVIRERINMQIHSNQSILKNTKKTLNDSSLASIKVNNPAAKKILLENIEKLGEEIEKLEGEIASLKLKLTDPEKDKLSIEEFLNLSRNAAKSIKSGNPVEKNVTARFIFLNLTVDEKNVLSYQAKEPFATLLKMRQQRLSRGQRT